MRLGLEDLGRWRGCECWKGKRVGFSCVFIFFGGEGRRFRRREVF